MIKENSSIQAFKVWIFPSLVSIVSLLIWNDVNEIKADVKALMAQSNIDKTRIDNLERVVYKTAASFPNSVPITPIVFRNVATLPNNKFNIENENIYKLSYLFIGSLIGLLFFTLPNFKKNISGYLMYWKAESWNSHYDGYKHYFLKKYGKIFLSGKNSL